MKEMEEENGEEKEARHPKDKTFIYLHLKGSWVRERFAGHVLKGLFAQKWSFTRLFDFQKLIFEE